MRRRKPLQPAKSTWYSRLANLLGYQPTRLPAERPLTVATLEKRRLLDAPEVMSVAVDDAELTDSDVGTDEFQVEVTFDQRMDTSVDPTLTFSPSVASTLTNPDSSWSANKKIFTVTYDVADANTFVKDVTIDVTGAEANDGDAQADFTPVAKFTINTGLGVTLNAATTPQAEGATYSFEVARATGDPTTTAIDVTYAVVGGATNPAAGNDFTGGSFPTNTVTIAAGKRTATIDIAVNNDMVVEADEQFELQLTSAVTSADGKGVRIDTPSQTAVITNNDSAILTIADISQNEETGTYTFKAKLDKAVEGGFTVDYAVAAGTTETGEITSALTGTLTFAGTAGEEENIVVTVADDAMVEGDETFTISLGTISPAGTSAVDAADVVTTDTATGTIVNTDTAAVTITDISQDEETGTYTFKAKLDKAVEGGFTVGYAVGAGTTETGEITSALTGTLTFAGTAGEEENIVVTVADDAIVEGDETFTVSLGIITPAGTPAVDAADVVTTDTATGTIVNTDTAAVTIADISQDEETGNYTFKAKLDKAVEGGFTVGYAVGAGTTETGEITSALTGTLTFAGTAGEEENIVVTVADDAIVEGDETFTVSLGTITSAATPAVDAADVVTTDTATGTIVNKDTAAVTIADISQDEETGNYTFKAKLDKAVEGGFTVDYTVAAGTTETGEITSALTGTLTFAGTAGEEENIVVTVADDAIVEGDETFTVSLGTITSAATPAVDAADVVTTDTATGTIVNTDTAAVTIADISQDEEPGTITFKATLDKQVEGGFTVDYVLTSIDTEVADTGPATGTLTFAGTVGEQEDIVVTVADTIVEGDETFTVSLRTITPAGTPAVNVADVVTTDTATGTIVNTDTATVTIDDLSQNEETGTFTFKAKLDNPVEGGFTVDYTITGIDTEASDITSAANGTLTFAGTANEEQDIVVTVADDSIIEGDETFTVSLGTLTPAGTPTVDTTDVDTTDTATGTIVNTDTAALTIADVSQNEESGTFTFKAKLDNPVEGGLAVGYTITNVDTLAADFTGPLTGTLLFVGSTNEEQDIVVMVNDDSIIEGDETFTVSLGNIMPAGTPTVDPTDVNTGDTATGTIVNTEATAVTIADISQNEETGTYTFKAKLDGQVSGFAVDYTIVPVDSDVSDFTSPLTGTLTFAGTAGEEQDIVVTANNDAIVEADEQFTVMLGTIRPATPILDASDVDTSDTATGTIVNTDTATVTIDDLSQNEETGSFTFKAKLDNAVEGGFTVDYTIAGIDTEAGDIASTLTGTLTFAGAANEEQDIVVTVANDAIVEGDERFTVSLGTITPTGTPPVDATDVITSDTATGTIVNTDTATVTIDDLSQNEETSTFTFKANLDNAVEGGFTVDYTITNIDTVAADLTGPLTGTLTFAGTANEEQDIVVTVANDTIIEGDEQFQVSLGAIKPTGTPTVDAADVNTSDTAIGTIVNADIAAITIADISQNEEMGSYTFKARLDSQVGPFTVDYTITGIDTTAGEITSVTTGTLTFAGNAGEEQDIGVTVADDVIVEGNETFTVSLGPITPGIAGIDANDVNTSDTATGTIVNTDTAAVTITDLILNEEPGTFTFKAVLNRQVEGGFTVDYTITAIDTETGDATPVTGTLTFAGVAGEEQNIVVMVDDAIVEGDERFTVSLGTINSTGTTPVDAASIDTSDEATGTIVNTDTARVTISDLSRNEESGTFTFKARLDNPVESGFTVDYLITGIDTEASDITSGPTGTLTFAGTANEEQDIVVTVANDAIVEGDERFTVSLGSINPAGTPTVDATDVDTTDTATGTIINTDSAAVTIADITQNEEMGTYTFHATLDNPVEGGFTDSFTITGIDTEAGDVTGPLAGTLTFVGSAGEQQEIVVTVDNDAIVEVDEQFMVSLGAITPAGTPSVDATDVNTSDTAIGTIANTDTVTVSVAATTVTETDVDGSANVAVSLSAPVEGGFTVDFQGIADTATADDFDAMGTLTFGDSVIETQMASVTISGDTRFEANDEQFQVQLSNVQNTLIDTTAFTLAPNNVTIENDDTRTSVIVNGNTLTIRDEVAGGKQDNLTFTVDPMGNIVISDPTVFDAQNPLGKVIIDGNTISSTSAVAVVIPVGAITQLDVEISDPNNTNDLLDRFTFDGTGAGGVRAATADYSLTDAMARNVTYLNPTGPDLALALDISGVNSLAFTEFARVTTSSANDITSPRDTDNMPIVVPNQFTLVSTDGPTVVLVSDTAELNITTTGSVNIHDGSTATNSNNHGVDGLSINGPSGITATVSVDQIAALSNGSITINGATDSTLTVRQVGGLNGIETTGRGETITIHSPLAIAAGPLGGPEPSIRTPDSQVGTLLTSASLGVVSVPSPNAGEAEVIATFGEDNNKNQMVTVDWCADADCTGLLLEAEEQFEDEPDFPIPGQPFEETFTNTYERTPTGNPDDPVNVSVMLEDAPDIMLDFDGDGEDDNRVITIITISPDVAATPQPVEPPAVASLQRLVFAAEIPNDPKPILDVGVAEATGFALSLSDPGASTARSYIIKIVSRTSEGKIQLSDPITLDLKKLGFENDELDFEELAKRLPDDRYRIYLKTDAGEEFIKEIIVRNKRPYDANNQELGEQLDDTPATNDSQEIPAEQTETVDPETSTSGGASAIPSIPPRKSAALAKLGTTHLLTPLGLLGVTAFAARRKKVDDPQMSAEGPPITSRQRSSRSTD